MTTYQSRLRAHLGWYGKSRLGVLEAGVYRGRHYAHILPYHSRFLNFPEAVRGELIKYLRKHESIRLHQYFHHLTSSQAFALNLYFPFLVGGKTSRLALGNSLRVDAPHQ